MESDQRKEITTIEDSNDLIFFCVAALKARLVVPHYYFVLVPKTEICTILLWYHYFNQGVFPSTNFRL